MEKNGVFELIAPSGNVRAGEYISAHLRYTHAGDVLRAGAFIRLGMNFKNGAHMRDTLGNSACNAPVSVSGNARICREPVWRRSIGHLRTAGVSDLYVIDIEITEEGLRQGESVDIYLGGRDAEKPSLCPGILARDSLDFFYHVDAEGRYPLVSLHPDAPGYMQYISPDGKEFPQWRSAGVSINLFPSYPRYADLVLPGMVIAGEKTEMRVIIYDRFYNNIAGYEGMVDIAEPERAERTGIRFKPSIFNTGKNGYAAIPVTFMQEGMFTGLAFRVAGLGVAEANPCRVTEKAGMRIFWGDLHGHSSLSDGGGPGPDVFFHYAKDIRGLDFSALSDHAFGLAVRGHWTRLEEVVRKSAEDGRFVPILGYEIMTDGHGHRSVYFPGDTGKLLMADYQPGSGGSFIGENIEAYRRTWDPAIPMCPTLEGFIAGLEGVDCLYTAHHCGDLIEKEKTLLRLYEACSEWGISEKCARQNTSTATIESIFAQGLSPGLTGGSDDHKACAGFMGRGCLSGGPIRYPSGLTAVLCSSLDRHGIYEALYRKHCYATTGARILIEPDVRRENRKLRVVLYIAGTAPLARIWVCKNGKEVFHLYCRNDSEEILDWQDTSFGEKDVYYIRISQADGHMAWINPLPFAS